VADFLKQVNEVSEGVLQPGEAVAAASWVQGSQRVAGYGSAGGGLVGAVAGEVMDRRAQKKEAAEKAEEVAALPPEHPFEIPAQNGAVLAITDRRIILFSRGGMSGKAKEPIFDLPLEEIERVDRDERASKLTSGMPKAVLLTFWLRSNQIMRMFLITAMATRKSATGVLQALAGFPGESS
jgi:hypothetical protein